MLELQNEFQSHQLELMSDSVGAIRKMRHDFIKHISMIHYFNTEKRADIWRISKVIWERLESMWIRETMCWTAS